MLPLQRVAPGALKTLLEWDDRPTCRPGVQGPRSHSAAWDAEKIPYAPACANRIVRMRYSAPCPMTLDGKQEFVLSSWAIKNPDLGSMHHALPLLEPLHERPHLCVHRVAPSIGNHGYHQWIVHKDAVEGGLRRGTHAPSELPPTTRTVAEEPARDPSSTQHQPVRTAGPMNLAW